MPVCLFAATKKSASQETLPRSGYANNFGHSVGGEGYRGVEGVLLANLTKTLVTRCVACTKELYNQDNIVRFGRTRQPMSHCSSHRTAVLELERQSFIFPSQQTQLSQ
jgi:hypothetical protein